MTLLEAEGYLFFVRDEMLKDFSYDASVVWRLPTEALKDPRLAKLISRWLYATKKDMRKYIETRIISHLSNSYEYSARA